MKKLLIPAISALIIGGAVANAQDRGDLSTSERVDNIMERFDANKDGVIDSTDREALRLQKFQELDTNSDGVLSEEELVAGREARKEQREERRAERRSERRGQVIEALDTDGDGSISYEEYSAAPDKRTERRGERSGKRRGDHEGKGHGDRRRHHGRRRGGPGGERMLEHADANKDGIVTREELETAIEARKADRPRRSSGS